jgi:hypothetical protein
MKLVHHLLYVLYNILLLLIAAILLISIIIVAITKSWLYFFLYIPISLFFYESRIVNYKKAFGIRQRV